MREIAEILLAPRVALPPPFAPTGQEAYMRLMTSEAPSIDGGCPAATHYAVRSMVEHHALTQISDAVKRGAQIAEVVAISRRADAAQQWLSEAYGALNQDERPAMMDGGVPPTFNLSAAYKARAAYGQAHRQRHRLLGRVLAEAFADTESVRCNAEAIRLGIASISAVSGSFYRNFVEVRLLRRVSEVAAAFIAATAKQPKGLAAVMKYVGDEIKLAREMLPQEGWHAHRAALLRALESTLLDGAPDLSELLLTKGPAHEDAIVWTEVLLSGMGARNAATARAKVLAAYQAFAVASLNSAAPSSDPHETAKGLLATVALRLPDDAEPVVQNALTAHYEKFDGATSAIIAGVHRLLRTSMHIDTATLRAVTMVFRAAPDKDRLGQEYWVPLATRLLHSPNLGSERAVVAAMAEACGRHSATKFSRMVEDVADSVSLLDVAAPALTTSFPIHATILTAMQWPNLRVDPGLGLPMPFAAFVEPIGNVFRMQGPRRRLQWSMHVGEVTLRWLECATLLTTPAYAAILLLMNTHDEVTLAEARRAVVDAPPTEVSAWLARLVASRVLVATTLGWAVSPEAPKPHSRMAIGISSAALASIQPGAKNPQRKAVVEAAIIRVLKRTGRPMAVTAFPAAVTAEVRDRIVPSPAELDDAIRSLRARECISLDAAAQTLTYAP